MVTAIISLLAVLTFGLIAGAFVSALMQLNEIDPASDPQPDENILAARQDGSVMHAPGVG